MSVQLPTKSNLHGEVFKMTIINPRRLDDIWFNPAPEEIMTYLQYWASHLSHNQTDAQEVYDKIIVPARKAGTCQVPLAHTGYVSVKVKTDNGNTITITDFYSAMGFIITEGEMRHTKITRVGQVRRRANSILYTFVKWMNTMANEFGANSVSKTTTIPSTACIGWRRIYPGTLREGIRSPSTTMAADDSDSGNDSVVHHTRPVWFAIFPNTASKQHKAASTRKNDLMANGILYKDCPVPELLTNNSYAWDYGNCAETFVFLYYFKAGIENAACMELMGLTVKTAEISSPLVRSVEAAERVVQKRPPCLNCSLLVILHNQDLRRHYYSTQIQDPNKDILLMKYHDLAADQIIGSAQCVACGAYSPLEPCKSCGVTMACTGKGVQCLRVSLDPLAGRPDAMRRHGACSGKEWYFAGRRQ